MLTSDDRTKLIDALRQLYPDRAALATFLRDSVQKTLSDLSLGETMIIVRGDVINKAEEYPRWTADLVNALRNVAPADVKASLDTIDLDEDQHFHAHLLADRPFVDRKDLRPKLKALAGNGEKILIVRGDRGSGKSHTRYLIEYIGEKLGFRTIRLSLLDYTGSEVTPYDLGRAITDEMNLTLPANLDEKAARWNVNFLTWLAGKVNENNAAWWIIIDDFEHMTLSPAVYEFVEALAKRVDGRFGRVRLVLISYNQDLSSNLEPIITRDEIPPIEEPDLVDYFLDFFGRYLPRSESEETATDMLTNLVRKVHTMMSAEPREKKLETMSRALLAECRRLKQEHGVP